MNDKNKPKYREFWIDDIYNVDRPNQKTAYLHYQDTEKCIGNTIHVVEYSALQAAEERIKELESISIYNQKVASDAFEININLKAKLESFKQELFELS